MGLRAYALITGVLCATAVLGATDALQVLLLEGSMVAAATAIMAWGIRRHRPERPDAWWLLLAGPWLVLLGVVALEVAVAAGAAPIVVESTILLEVAGYVALTVGMARLIRPGTALRGGGRLGRLDPVVLLLATGFLGWGLVNPDFPHEGLPGVIERLAGVAQLVLAALCLLVALAVAAAVDRRGRPAALWLVGAAGMLTAVQFLLPFLDRVVLVEDLDDVGLLVGLLLLAAAASDPTMAAVAPRDRVEQRTVRVRLIALLLALAAPPLALLADRLSGGMVQPDALLVAWGLLTVVVMHRMMVLTREREQVMHQVLRQALHDELTGVLNRRGLLDELQTVFDRADGDEVPVGVLYLDLDAFKPVNDEHGHVVGDLVLQVVAGRLVEAAGPDAVVGRLGGDEFIVLLPGVAGRSELIEADHVVCSAVTRPMDLGDVTVQIGVSSGVDLRPPHGHAPLDSLIRADKAMYASKGVDAPANRVIRLARRDIASEQAS